MEISGREHTIHRMPNRRMSSTFCKKERKGLLYFTIHTVHRKNQKTEASRANNASVSRDMSAP